MLFVYFSAVAYLHTTGGKASPLLPPPPLAMTSHERPKFPLPLLYLSKERKYLHFILISLLNLSLCTDMMHMNFTKLKYLSKKLIKFFTDALTAHVPTLTASSTGISVKWAKTVSEYSVWSMSAANSS